MKFDIVALQETRGNAADLALLPTSHIHFGTFGDDGTWGGCSLSVSRALADKADSIESFTVVQGRAISV